MFLRDIAQAIGISRAVFDDRLADRLYARDDPPPALAVAYVNPLFYIIELYRQVLIFGVVSPRFWSALIVMAIAAFFGLGMKSFRRLKPTCCRICLNSDIAICATDVSRMFKRYRHPRYRVMEAFGLPLPKNAYDEFWALRRVSLELRAATA